MILTPGSFDFLALVSFVWKSNWEGSFDYTWENYPPTFRDPELRSLESDFLGFWALLRDNREAMHQWEHMVGLEEASRLVNKHREEADRERDSRCLWAVRFANGNISCERDEEIAYSPHHRTRPGPGGLMSDRTEIQAIHDRQDALRWQKLMAMVGGTPGWRMRDVMLLWCVDGPTAVVLVQGLPKITAKSFEKALDEAPWPPIDEGS